MDCGNGVFAKLRRFADYADVDAVVISHLHADHFLDLVPFSYALTYGPRRQPDRRPALHAPPGARDMLPPRRRRVGQRGPDREGVRAARVRPRARCSHAGPLSVRFQPVPHFVATNAIELRPRAGGGGRFTFGADCGPSEELCALRARHRPAADRGDAAGARARRPARPLTPAEAGEHGRKAGARRLVLTHLTDELDTAWVRRGGRARVRRAGRDRARGRRLRALITDSLQPRG